MGLPAGQGGCVVLNFPGGATISRHDPHVSFV